MPRTFKFRGTDYAFEDSITDEEVFTFFVKKDPSAAKGMDPLAVEQTVRIGMDRLQQGAAREESTLSKLTPDFIEDPARAVMGAGAQLATGAAVGVNKGLDMLADAAVELGPDPADNTLPARVYRRIAEDMKASTEYELNKSRRMYEYSKEFAKPSAAGEFQQFSDIVNPRRALPAVAGGVATTVSLALTGGAAVPLIFGTEYLDMYDRLAQEAPEESELRRSLKAAGYAAGATALEYAGTVGQVGAGAGLKYLKDAKLIPSTKLLNRLTDGPKNALFTYLVGSKRTRAVLGIGGEVITENLQDELQRYTLNEKATWEDYATTTALTALSAGFVTGSFTHLNTQSQKARENFVATLPSAYVQEHRATLARWVFGQYADAELFEDLNKAGIDPISNPNFDLTGKTEETRSVEFKDLNPELAMEFSRVKNKPLYESFLRGDTSLAEFYQTVYKAGNTGNYDGLSKGETFALLEFFAKNNILQELQDVTLHHSKTLPQDRIRVLKNVGIEGLGIERVQDMLWGAAQNTTNPRTGRVYETVEEYVNSPEGLTLIESITETEAKRLMQEEANRKNQPGPKPDDMIKGMFEPGDYYRFKLTLGQADVTTAVHETTHLITHRIDPESELAKTLVAFARKRGSKVKSLTEFGEKEHEDVARLAEAYLLTEQAPENATSEEKSAAARMAGMFKAVYENNYKDFGGAPDKFFGRKPAHKSFFDYLFYGRGSLPVFKTPDLVNLDDELWNPSATFSDEDFSPDFIPLEGSQTATSQSMPMRPAAPSALLTGPTQRLGLPAPVGTQLESGETIPLEGPTIPSGPTIPLGGQVQGPEVEVGQGFMKRKVQITFPDGPHNELYYLREELEKIGDLEAAETGDEASFLRRQHTKYLNALAEELGLPKLERDDKASSKKRKEARNDFINTMLAVSDEYQRAVKEAATAGEKAPSLDDLYSKAEYFRGNQLYLTKAGKEGAGERFYQTGKRSEPDLSFAKVIDEKGRTRAVAKADPRLAGVLAGMATSGTEGGASYGKAGSIDTIGRLYQRGRRKYVNGSSINENLAKGLKYPASMKEGITAKKLSWDFGAAAQIASGILKDPKHLQRIVEDAREGKTLLPPEEIMALHEFYVLQLTRLEQMKAKGSAYATAQEKVFRERLEKVRSEYGSRLGAGLAALGHAEGMHIFEELAKLIETRTGRLQRQIYAQMSLTDFAMLEESVSKKTAVEFMEELAKHPKMSDFQKRVVAAVDLTNPEKARFQIADALLALKKNQFLHGAIQAYQYTNMLLKPGARGSDFGSNVGMRLLSLYGIKPGRVAADMLFTGLGLQPHRQEFFREIPLNPFRAFKGFGKGITVAKDIITGALPWQEAQFRDKWEVSLSQAAHAGELLWKHGGPLTKIAALPLMATPRIVVAIDAMERVVSEEVMGDMMATRFAIMKKNGTYDQEITRMATELADKQKVAPEDRDAFIAALKQNPSLLIQTVGQAFATANTFTQAPGKVTSAIMSMRDAADKGFRDTTGAPFSPVKSLAMPFVVTLANVMKTGVALTPAAAGIMTGNLGWSAYTVGAGILAPKMWGDKWKEIIGKQIAAHAMLYFLNWALDNDWLVGAPKSAAERDAWERQKQGKEAYSFKVMFGEEPTYFRIPMPFAWALVPAIQALERLKAAEKFGVDSPEAKTAFAEARSATWQFLLNSSFTRTALRFIGNQGEFNTTRSVASFLPMSGMFRELNNTYKTLVEGKATQLNSREANPLNAAMQETYGEHFTKWFGQVIPGLEEDIPERITYFGQPYSRSEFLDQVSIPQQWLPRQDIEKAHAIEFEFERLEFYPGLPQKAFKLGNRDIELNDDQYRDYCLYYGQLVYQNASQLIDMPQYRKMPDETQSKVVKGFLERMRSAARAKVVQTHQLLLY